MKVIDLTGKQFGRLTVVGFYGKSPNGKLLMWLCECECGGYTKCSTADINRIHTKSCGCLQKEIVKKIKTKHGMSKEKVYAVWKTIKDRCLNKNNKKYMDYGGRGITICNEWAENFDNFFKDMGFPEEGKSIDRIDNSKGYYKENCRWATRTEQTRNTRRNRLISFNGKTMCLQEWANILGVPRKRISDRLNMGWSIKKALTLGVYK